MFDGTRLPGAFRDRMQHANANSISLKTAPRLPVKRIPYSSVGFPDDGAAPEILDRPLPALDVKSQMKRLLFDLLRQIAEVRRDSSPVLVAHGGIYRAHDFMIPQADIAQN